MKINSAMDLIPDVKKAREVEDNKFREASKLYEQQFIREMVKAMRSTVKPSGLIKENFAEKLFKEQLDEEYVQGWSNRGGVGMADMIYTQLKERFSTFSDTPMTAPKGPLPLNPPTQEGKNGEGKTFHMIDSPQIPGSSQFLFQGDPEGFEVTSPWSGKVSQVFAIDGGQQVLEIAHDNGLRSKLVFEGHLTPQLQGAYLSGGDSIGRAFGASATLSWKVTKSA